MLGAGITAAMLAIECLEVGLSTLTKAALNKGMSNFVFVVYYNAFGTIFILLPCCLILYRNRSRPPLTLSIICKIFLLGLFSCFSQTCLFSGIGYSSPTLASALVNITPAFTFILVIISRMEKLDLRVKSSLAKSIGTLVSIAGALTVTLYNGPAITSTLSLNLHNNFLSPHKEWVIGGILLASGSCSLSILYIVQKPKCLETKARLGVAGYCVLTLRGLVHTWACHKKGALYVSMFKPLSVVIAVAMGVTFLGDTLYLGSVLGAAIIAFGFYSLIWGQGQEEKMIDDKGINNLKPSSSTVPLLQNKSTEVQNFYPEVNIMLRP
ncbi:WAT1-related protein At5g40240-like isoform X3 [Pistacia vera]|uniref:WAT1-related protein At5g40240-like isoform X3 n=1 Tax=Pistacia vera TaxID=55513 RepID=UPI001262EE1A|nr:WAT1-related protein At5g40240-like isoform X3 [Pistacia vera]XP_031263167.1 WAT1-related protein At5g40240-like isoform X3 [Pistacia vera]